MDVHQWRAAPDAADEQLFLDPCDGPTLDVGCGPGRLVGALTARRVPALGIDVSVEAIRQARTRGALALRRDVFSSVPGQGRWDLALLADGNVGIGGDVETLLLRLRGLLDVGGRVVAELAEPGAPSGRREVTVEVDGNRSAPFWWAAVAPGLAITAAAAAGFAVVELGRLGGRWYTVLESHA
jgi:SAM-dependent methyltransferase